MCRFSHPVATVANTHILARHLGPTQILVYAMAVDSPTANAMIIPLPTPPDVGEDAIEWIDLSAIPTFFESLGHSLGISDDHHTATRGGASLAAPPTLAVHEVGDFEASYVPTLADFDRLDERFRLEPGLRASLVREPDWSFAVFQLQPGRQAVHPMAWRFPTRFPRRCYFPTVHVHDGEEPTFAAFDHALFAQFPGSFRLESERDGTSDDLAELDRTGRGEEARLILSGHTWSRHGLRRWGAGMLDDWQDLAAEAGILDLDRGVLYRRMTGHLDNEDVWVDWAP